MPFYFSNLILQFAIIISIGLFQKTFMGLKTDFHNKIAYYTKKVARGNFKKTNVKGP